MLCAICNCRNNSNNSSLSKGGISFHLFPKNITLKEKWIAATGRKNWSPTKTSTICSIHFLEEDYTLSSKIRRLNSEACPTVDVWISSKTTTKVENKKRSSQLERLRIAKEAKRKKTASNKFEKSTVKNEKKISHDDDMSSDSASREIKKPIRRGKAYTLRLKNKIKKLEMQSKQRLKKSHRLGEVARRLRKKDAETRDMILEIKDKMDKKTKRVDIISHLGSENKSFYDHITNKASCPSKVTKPVRNFALGLYRISPEAYEFVQSKFDSCLPPSHMLEESISCKVNINV